MFDLPTGIQLQVSLFFFDDDIELFPAAARILWFFSDSFRD